MVSLSTLESQIRKHRANADSKHKLVQSLNASADSHDGVDDARAELDRKSAERYQQEAEEEEKQAGIYEAEILLRQQRAASVEKEIDDLKASHEKQLRDLEAKRDSIINS